MSKKIEKKELGEAKLDAVELLALLLRREEALDAAREVALANAQELGGGDHLAQVEAFYLEMHRRCHQSGAVGPATLWASEAPGSGELELEFFVPEGGRLERALQRAFDRYAELSLSVARKFARADPDHPHEVERSLRAVAARFGLAFP